MRCWCGQLVNLSFNTGCLQVAPELAEGQSSSEQATPDTSIDVYSYGILLFALTTCEEPYRELRRVNPLQLLAMVGVHSSVGKTNSNMSYLWSLHV